MQTKTCKDCGVEKPITEFYRHPEMTDGYLNSCKECKKSYQRRRAELGFTREYERRRNRTPERRAYIASVARAWNKRYPERYKAHYTVTNAIRDGRLERGTECTMCGATDNIEAHHADYSKPLDVTWICTRCHRRYHLAV